MNYCISSGTPITPDTDVFCNRWPTSGMQRRSEVLWRSRGQLPPPDWTARSTCRIQTLFICGRAQILWDHRRNLCVQERCCGSCCCSCWWLVSRPPTTSARWTRSSSPSRVTHRPATTRDLRFEPSTLQVSSRTHVHAVKAAFETL